jgi:hypothetical protein
VQFIPRNMLLVICLHWSPVSGEISVRVHANGIADHPSCQWVLTEAIRHPGHPTRSCKSTEPIISNHFTAQEQQKRLGGSSTQATKTTFQADGSDY